MLKKTASAFLLLAICAHAQAKEPRIRTYNSYGGMFSSEKPKAGEPVGCVAGSLGRWISRGNHVSITLQFQLTSALGTRKQIAATYWTESLWGQNAEIKDGDSARDIFRLCLRPGDYRFTSFVVTHGYLTQTTPGDMTIPISIEAGKTVYIGSFLLMEQGETHPCTGGQTMMRLIREDRSEIDLPLLNRFTEGVDATKDIITMVGNEPFLYDCLSPVTESQGVAGQVLSPPSSGLPSSSK